MSTVALKEFRYGGKQLLSVTLSKPAPVMYGCCGQSRMPGRPKASMILMPTMKADRKAPGAPSKAQLQAARHEG